MNLKQAQYVKTIAECGSITAAAKKLFVSQPSLSQMLRQLEQETGLPIFDRSTSPMRLTYAGEKYLHAAERILAANAELESQLEPLAKASETARHYLALRDELRVLECSSFVLRSDRARERIDDAQRMLDGLRETADLAIISNGMPEYLALSLRVMGLEKAFVRVQGQIPGKTKGEALSIVLAELTPSRAVMVGDRLGDLLAGRQNGLSTVAACYGYGN